LLACLLPMAAALAQPLLSPEDEAFLRDQAAKIAASARLGVGAWQK
jgi:hypothetical protein